MRLKISFSAYPCSIPLNYNYHLAAFIYKRLKIADEALASILHESGYGGFKLFTFSQLFLTMYTVNKDVLILKEGCKGTWFVSSINDDFLKAFMSSLLQKPYLEICGENFEIVEIEVPTNIEFSSRMKFKMLSPMVLSIPVEFKGKLSHKYLVPSDPEYQNAFERNLKKKFMAIYGKESTGSVKIYPDWEYISSRSKITKLIQIKDTFIKACLFPFEVEGDVELIKIGYEAGFGEKNAMGFGMVECV
nr:CRISPR-associated endoribonuclease Cas6 [Pseudothermotoga thermarum]